MYRECEATSHRVACSGTAAILGRLPSAANAEITVMRIPAYLLFCFGL